MLEINWKNIKEKLSSAKSIVITSHQSPDGDAVGSSLALHNYFKKIGVSSKVVLPDEFPSFYNWMNSSDEVLYFSQNKIEVEDLIKSSDVLFALDYNSTSRVGDMGALIDNSSAFKIMIDHHLNPSDFADEIISDSSKCSTAQMIFEFIEELGDIDKIDSKIGECLYTGLVTDTGSFRFSSVDEKTHEISAYLISKGMQQHLIHEAIFNQNSVNRIKLRGHIMTNNLDHLPELKSSIIYLSEDEGKRFNIQPGDTEGLVNEALSIKGTQIAAFFREDGDKIKISFRSVGDTAVNALSNKYFNGGGHKNAAGGRLENCTLNEAMNRFKEVVHEFI